MGPLLTAAFAYFGATGGCTAAACTCKTLTQYK